MKNSEQRSCILLTFRISRQTWSYANDVRIQTVATAVGPKESQGPLGSEFDIAYTDSYMGESTWEKAEMKLLKDAISLSIEKDGSKPADIDGLIAGDLLNQMISSTFASRSLEIPFIGVYGACSTSMLSLSQASALVNAGYANKVVAACCSHNSTAERQYRYPTEYGGQKPVTAQFTATGAGAALVSKGGNGIKVTYATIGKIVDMGIKNPFDMGTAMAPAAADTLNRHFLDTGRKPNDYDLIVTGDLASVGAPILIELMKDKGYDIKNNYSDCGLMLYHKEDAEVFSGASGCASSALVAYGHLFKEMEQGRLKRLLVIATGALLSPTSYQQGESIPCIAHAVSFEI